MTNITFVGNTKRSRSSNVATSLVKNSKSAFILAIEIHNKPVCEYRLQSVVIFMIHAWELLLKAYCYKHLKDKKILQKDGDNRYPQLSQIIERIYHTNTGKFRILRENVETLNEYRNLLVHAYGFENMDQLIFELVVKSVLLYRDFIREYFSSHDLEGIADTPILPIAFKLPYTPIDILTHNFASANTSKEVLNFIDSVKNRINVMTQEGIEESIFISIRTEFINENNMKNSDISALISKDGIQFQKETKNRLVSDKGAEPMRGLFNKEETEEKFPIPTKKSLTEKVKVSVGGKWTTKGGAIYFNKITKDLESQYEGSEWYPNIKNGGKRYTNNFYDLVMAKYE